MSENKLSVGEMFIYEWQYSALGSFKRSLAESMVAADGMNLNKLAKGFPEEVEAYRNYTDTKGWWEDVQNRARN